MEKEPLMTKGLTNFLLFLLEVLLVKGSLKLIVHPDFCCCWFFLYNGPGQNIIILPCP